MAEYDLTERLIEQLKPTIETMNRRLESDLTNRDKAAVGHALVEAATTGARVAWATVLANAAEAGIELPSTLNFQGLQNQDLWPFDD